MKQFGSLCTLIVFLALAAVPGLLLAQTDAEALEDHMRDYERKVNEKRNSALSTILQMTDEQSKVFRSLQKAYAKEVKQLGKKEQALGREFSEIFDKLTVQSAEQIGQRFFDLATERLQIQKKYLDQISEQVSPVVAVQFIQLERRFETQIENERMKYAPLAE